MVRYLFQVELECETALDIDSSDVLLLLLVRLSFGVQVCNDCSRCMFCMSVYGVFVVVKCTCF